MGAPLSRAWLRQNYPGALEMPVWDVMEVQCPACMAWIEGQYCKSERSGFDGVHLSRRLLAYDPEAYARYPL